MPETKGRTWPDCTREASSPVILLDIVVLACAVGLVGLLCLVRFEFMNCGSCGLRRAKDGKKSMNQSSEKAGQPTDGLEPHHERSDG